MKHFLLLLAFLCILVQKDFAIAAVSCTEASLRSTVEQKKTKGMDITNLHKKSWWTRCPLSVRKTVYASLLTPLVPSSLSSSPTVKKKSDLPILRKAPEFQGLGAWVNSAPLTMAALKGKVVLVYFWTYTCINCIHTQPFVAKYWETYKEKRFMIIGVHTPEFTFEKSESNVRKAVKDAGIQYPVVQDNEFATWNAFSNRYWPAFYLVDGEGNIRYEHFGEGEYDTMDKTIRELLGEIGV